MITPPAKAFGRPAAIAALIGFCILVSGLLAIPAVAAFNARDSEIASTLRQIGAYQSKIAALPQVQAQLDTLKNQGRGLQGVMASESASIAQAQMQTDIKSIVEGNRGQVRSANLMPVIQEHGFDVIVVQYDLSLPVTRLKDVVYAIESHMPYFFFEDAKITGPLGWPSADQTAAEPKLEIRATIRGYRWPSK